MEGDGIVSNMECLKTFTQFRVNVKGKSLDAKHSFRGDLVKCTAKPIFQQTLPVTIFKTDSFLYSVCKFYVGQYELAT